MSKNNEWYTPSEYIDAARDVMGGIDLDPASCAMANQTVKAARYYTKEQNGLMQDWTCSCMRLNPPFGTTRNRSNIGLFTEKLLHEYQKGKVEQALLMTISSMQSSWFPLLWDFPICFIHHEIKFLNPSLTHIRCNHRFGWAITYLGLNSQKFIDTFSKFGCIARAVDTPKVKPVNLELWSA